jgi:hypothetical protein
MFSGYGHTFPSHGCDVCFWLSLTSDLR